jgi:uncharacterized protein (TIGR02466 family)
MNVKKHELFPTIVLDYDFSNHPQNDKLLSVIKEEKTKNHGLVDKGTSSFVKTSRVNFLKKTPKLLIDFQKCVNHYCDTLGIYPGKISHSWFNIMKKGGKTHPHIHRGCILIGIYYPLLEPNSCDLILTNPLNYNKQCEITTNPNEYNSSNILLKIQQNHLYICPGWIEHQTEINKSNERIVVSFNVYPNYY